MKGLTRLEAAGMKTVGPECSELDSREYLAFLHLMEAEKNHLEYVLQAKAGNVCFKQKPGRCSSPLAEQLTSKEAF